MVPDVKDHDLFNAVSNGILDQCTAIMIIALKVCPPNLLPSTSNHDYIQELLASICLWDVLVPSTSLLGYGDGGQALHQGTC